MSQNQRRYRNGGTAARTQPTILKSRKRKISENELEPLKLVKREEPEMATVNTSPLGDVTSTLNVERERAITPEAVPDEWQRFRSFAYYPTPQSKRRVPLPDLNWADKNKLWAVMCRKDSEYKINPNYLVNHSALQGRMRAILLDWLTEVCEVYRLHRETYYLATSYIDRYLSLTKDIPKQQLQLIGITSLFIAAKIEEIYPPKLSEFSYVTDGACTDEEILEKELVILKALKWNLSPVTSNCWLNTYLQILEETNSIVNENPRKETEGEDNFIFPNYSGLTFVQVSRLLDLCSLDISSLAFTPSELAATALSFFISPSLAFEVAGYSAADLRECYGWMGPLVIGIQDLGPAPLKSFSQISPDDVHNIQTHAVTLDILEKGLARRSQIEEIRSSPPISQVQPPGVLTPPKTDEKTKSN